MATTEYDEPDSPGGLAAAQLWLTGAVATATDTSPALPLRIWILLICVGLCCLFAPVPINAIGVVATLALAMSQRRSR